MKLLMTDGDGAIMQEYGAVTASADGQKITCQTLIVRIPGETNLASCGHPANEDGECDCASWPERAAVNLDNQLYS